MGQDLKGHDLELELLKGKMGVILQDSLTREVKENRSISKNFKSVVDGWQKQRI